jgi:hypothetical protein
VRVPTVDDGLGPQLDLLDLSVSVGARQITDDPSNRPLFACEGEWEMGYYEFPEGFWIGRCAGFGQHLGTLFSSRRTRKNPAWGGDDLSVAPLPTVAMSASTTLSTLSGGRAAIRICVDDDASRAMNLYIARV